MALPFQLDDLPPEVRGWVARAVEDVGFAPSARRALEDLDGEPTSAVLLARAWVRLQEACEITVDDLYDATLEVLEGVEEAQALGAPESPALLDLVEQATALHEEEWARRQAVEDRLHVDPDTLTQGEASEVAHELLARGRHQEAIPWFERLVAGTSGRDALHYGMNLARCRYLADQAAPARVFWEGVVGEPAGSDPRVVDQAWCGLLLSERDPARFHARFQEALSWARSAGVDFPSRHRDRERLLGPARGAGSVLALQHLIALLEGSGEYLTRDLREQLQALRF